MNATLKRLLNLIKREVEEFASLIDEDIGVQIGEDSCAYTDSNDIVIGLYATLYRDNVVDLAHEQYYRDYGFDYEKFGINYETFVILHEIGHLRTVPSEIEIRKYNRLEKKISNNEELNDHEKLIAYFQLELEIDADNWAMDYIRKFPTIVRDFNSNIQLYKNNLLNLLTE